MRSVLVIAPHPDDETLGCGGTLLKMAAEGARMHWLILTAMTAEGGFSAEAMATRQAEISAVSRAYGFASVHQLGFPAAQLDRLPMSDLIGAMARVTRETAPDTIFAPYPGDVHSDHRIAFAATAAVSKSFRQPSVKRILAYETLSETDFAIDPDANGFRANVFSDISGHLDRKLEILAEYRGELGLFPFPRSEQAVRALASLRGVAAGSVAAEAFMLLKEIW